MFAQPDEQIRHYARVSDPNTTTWRPARGPSPIRVDFNDMPARGVVGLNVPTTRDELARFGIVLQPGTYLNVWDTDGDEAGQRDDLIASGTVVAGDQPDAWFLELDGPVRSQSDERA